MIEIAARLPIRQTILSITLIFVIAQAATAQSTLAGGGAFTLVVKSDGTVWSFGLNNNGQLGINSLVINKTPIQIPGLSGVATVAAGGVHSMALTSTGALYTWGDNLYGQLGVTGPIARRPCY